jgi:hypothetical protein
MKSQPKRPGLPSEYRFERKLRSATLTVAVLVLFFILVLTLTALFWLLLTGLTTLLALSGLSGLLTLLALSELTTLLILLFRIVCHEYSSYKARAIPRLENLSTSET